VSAISEPDVLDLLTRLVEKSLVVYEGGEDGSGRYHLLETVRQYGIEKLSAEPASDAFHRRHRDYLLCLAEEAEGRLGGPHQGEWLDRLEAEHGNLRAALEFCAQEPDSGDAGLRLAGSLHRFWETRGYFSEGRERCRVALTHPGAQAPARDRAAALHGAGWLAYRQNDHAAANELLGESLRISRGLADRLGEARCFRGLGALAFDLGDAALARNLFEEALALHREVGDRLGEARALNNLGVLARGQSDYEQAHSLFEQACRLCELIGDRTALLFPLGNLGQLVFRQGDIPAARSLLSQALAIEREMGDRRSAASDMESLAEVEVHEGHYARVARLLGAAAGLRQQLGAPADTINQAMIGRCLEALSAALPEEQLAAALAAGRAMDWEQAITYALGEADG
jgi:non-specific serine/threonine protein kinase